MKNDNNIGDMRKDDGRVGGRQGNRRNDKSGGNRLNDKNRDNRLNDRSRGNRLMDKSGGGASVSALFLGLAALLSIGLAVWFGTRKPKSPVTEGEHIEKMGEYWEVDVPTPNITEGVNDVQGIILHHTATADAENALRTLTSPKGGVSCHVLIDKDGTRYVLADPTAITWHAGKSRLNGRDGCNDFTIGIEFQGNTVEDPLTDDQIQSAIDYVVPLILHYNIPLKNIVTHEQIRRNFKEAHPEAKAHAKVDVTSAEHDKFMKALRQRMRSEMFPSFHT